jgi:acyl-CoA reductase-like NAD-dependent aldehyde dehydrogenase
LGRDINHATILMGVDGGEYSTRFFPGVVQCLSGDDSLGPMMTEHPGIDKISFTGSIATVSESWLAVLRH